MNIPDTTTFETDRRLPVWAHGLLALLTTLLAASVAASDPAPDPAGKMIAGWVEKVVMQPSQIRVSAKLDTGARTSSIHAEKIERFEKEGERWVRFTLVLEDEHDEVHRVPMETPIYRRVRIKQHDDAPEARPVVELEFCMAEQVRRAQFSLVDRGVFLYPVLLGRRFLADSFVVDPGETFLTRAECASPQAEKEKEKEREKEQETE
jgi:hypothetical protein